MIARAVLIVGAAALGAIAVPALAQTSPLLSAAQSSGGTPPPGANYAPTQPPRLILSHYKAKLRDLRAEALELQAQDGGSLTPADYRRVQAKLDAANADFHRLWRNSNAFSVDSMGNPI